MKKTLYTIVATLATVAQVSAYSKFGHLLVARIAYEELLQTDRGRRVIAHVESTLAKVPIKHESQYAFVAAAPFADDLRTNGFRGKNIKTQKNWHNDPTAYAPTGNYYNYHKRSQTVSILCGCSLRAILRADPNAIGLNLASKFVTYTEKLPPSTSPLTRA